MSIEKVNGCNRIYKAIPLAFDESLSYLEMLCKMLNQLNETIEQVNANTDWINNYSGDLSDIKEAIIQIESNIATLTNKVNKNTDDIADLYTYINAQINGLNLSLQALIEGNFNQLKNYIDYEINDLQEQIDNINIGATVIYNPTTGSEDTVQNVINDLYQLTNKDGITASEFDTLELTVSGFEAFDITAYEFDSQSGVILTQ